MGHTGDEEVFETAMLIAFILLGKMLESIARAASAPSQPTPLAAANSAARRLGRRRRAKRCLRRSSSGRGQGTPGAQVPADGHVLGVCRR